MNPRKDETRVARHYTLPASLLLVIISRVVFGLIQSLPAQPKLLAQNAAIDAACAEEMQALASCTRTRLSPMVKSGVTLANP